MDSNKHEVLQNNQNELSERRFASRLVHVWELGDNYFLEVHTLKLPLLRRSFFALLLAFIVNVLLCAPLLIILSKFNDSAIFLIAWLGMFGLVGSFGATAALVTRLGLTKAGFPSYVQGILSLWNAALLPSILFGPIFLMVFLQFEISGLISIPLFCALPGLIGGITGIVATLIKVAKENHLIPAKPDLEQ